CAVCCLPPSSHLPDRGSFPTRRSSDLERVADLLRRVPQQQAGLEGDGELLGELPGRGGFRAGQLVPQVAHRRVVVRVGPGGAAQDRKSTRLNSSHVKISYAVFCLKKKS